MNITTKRNWLGIAFAMAALVCTTLLSAGTGWTEPFYRDQNIRLIVATKPGGGYDTYARMLAPRLERYLPGVTVVVQNVPGAGHIIGTNKIYASKPDGLTFGTFSKSLLIAQLTDLKGVAFDLKRMSWLGSPAITSRVFIVSVKSPFRSIEDIRRSEQTCILSSSGIGAESHLNGLIIAKIFGIETIKVVAGYMGTEGEMAMMRGEVHAQIASSDSVMPMIRSGEAIPILVIGDKRLDDYPDVPLLTEITPPDQKPLIDLLTALSLLGRPYAGPPGIPENRLKELRQAFEQSWRDPGLMADAKKLERPINFVDGATVAELVESTMNQPEEIIQLLKQITKTR